MKEAGLFSLAWKDVIKGLYMAVILPVLITIQTSLANGELVLDWKKIGITAVVGFIGYLIKNFFTNNNDELLTKDK
jgi:hypothetical protein